MSLGSGTRLGSYEIIGLIGAGGMGEVYRARDTNLGRDVALKTLPAAVTHDGERLARFRREAQVLASLNHPNIASIYGLEDANPQRFLVLELVEGSTLADRISAGPIPVPETLAIARQIAEALLAAHERGIIHRDLKPANIALTRDDGVKVLDFGLAKATEPATGMTPDPLNSPTITSPSMLTGLGVILGTAAYMSPEQAKGRAADKRSDVWAYGAVLYEMLTGKRAFKGEDVSDTLACILRGDPDWDALPADVPPAVRALIEGCLQKNPRDRIADISTALFALRQHPAPVRVSQPPPTRQRALGSTRIWAASLLLAGGAAAGALAVSTLRRPSPPSAPAIVRFAIPSPDGKQLTTSRNALAVSPDGSRIVFAAEGRLYLRSLSDNETRPIAGADPAILPVFSPDGESIAFWADPALRRIAVSGGVPVTICDTAPAPFGLHWSTAGIFFVQPGKGLLRVSPNSGSPELLVPTTGAVAQGVQLLPDGDTLLFTLGATNVATSGFWDKARIMTLSLSTGRQTTILEGASEARYLPTGHLVYLIEGTMMAVPFDVKALKIGGGAVPIVEGVRRGAASAGGAGQFAFSETGVLAFVRGPARTGQDDVFLFDRAGNATPLRLPRGSYSYPRVSPDGKQLAVETTDGKNSAVSLYELSGATSLRRLTFGGNNRLPVWSADGKRVAFQSDREGDAAIFWQPVNGGPAERLTRPEKGTSHTPEAWSPTTDVLLFSAATSTGNYSLWMLSLKDRKVSRFGDVGSVFPPNASFSPDGRWVAYQSGDMGGAEATTYVEPFPATGTKFEISRGGRSLWSPDGKEILFIPAPSQLFAASIRTAPAFSVTATVSLPRRFGVAPPGSPRPYDILPDGRIVGVDAAAQVNEAGAQQLQVVLNWFEEVKRRVPRNQ